MISRRDRLILEGGQRAPDGSRRLATPNFARQFSTCLLIVLTVEPRITATSASRFPEAIQWSTSHSRAVNPLLLSRVKSGLERCSTSLSSTPWVLMSGNRRIHSLPFADCARKGRSGLAPTPPPNCLTEHAIHWRNSEGTASLALDLGKYPRACARSPCPRDLGADPGKGVSGTSGLFQASPMACERGSTPPGGGDAGA